MPYKAHSNIRPSELRCTYCLLRLCGPSCSGTKQESSFQLLLLLLHETYQICRKELGGCSWNIISFNICTPYLHQTCNWLQEGNFTTPMDIKYANVRKSQVPCSRQTTTSCESFNHTSVDPPSPQNKKRKISISFKHHRVATPPPSLLDFELVTTTSASRPG